MFLTYLRKSLWTLPWFVLLPFVVSILDTAVFNPEGRNFNITYGASGFADSIDEAFALDEEDYGIDEELLDDENFDFEDESGARSSPVQVIADSFWGRMWFFGVNPLWPILSNLLFLLLLPCAIGGANYGAKKALFYLGFVCNAVLSLGFPLIFYYWNTWYPLASVYFASGYFAVLIALYFCAYLLPFIIGSRFVASAYRKAFWFW